MPHLSGNQVRLVDSPEGTPNAGIAELKRNGQWGVLCYSASNTQHWAAVFCRQLGYAGVDDVTPQNKTSLSSTTYTAPECTFNETILDNCAISSQNLSDCDVTKDYFLVCDVNSPRTGENLPAQNLITCISPSKCVSKSYTSDFATFKYSALYYSVSKRPIQPNQWLHEHL